MFPLWIAFVPYPPATPWGGSLAVGSLWTPQGDAVVLWGGAEYPEVGSVSELRVMEAGPSQLRVTWRGLPGAGGYLLTWQGSDGECMDHWMLWQQCWSPSYPSHLLGVKKSRFLPADPTTFTIEGLHTDVVYTVGVSAIVDGREGRPVTATGQIGEVAPA